MPLDQVAPLSSPATTSNDVNCLSYYKAQYEQLEAELAEFQASSRELESELERDIEASEKRERTLQEKVESLGYEVEEWKVCKDFYEQRLEYPKLCLKLRDIMLIADSTLD